MEELTEWDREALSQTVREAELCAARATRFGLTLSPEQTQALAVGRICALRDTGRVEFGGGILPALIDAVCDSPYLQQETYAETLLLLQEVFYHWKNALDDTVPDGDVLRLLRRAFDEKARGAAEYLCVFSPQELQAQLGEEARNHGTADDGETL